MIRYHETEWMGMKLTCEYEYTPAEQETRTDPGVPEFLEVIEAINVEDVDLIDLLNEVAYDDLCNQVLAELKAERSEY